MLAAVSDFEGMQSVRGHNGTIEFDGATVAITRRGFLARATVGKGEKRIPVRHITAVQFKPAGLVNGFIAFTLAGGVENRSRFGRQTTDAAKDENSVIFTKSQQPSFEQLRTDIEQAMSAPAGPMAQAQLADPVAQLQQLAALHQSGALSNEEFAHAKASLLGRMR